MFAAILHSFSSVASVNPKDLALKVERLLTNNVWLTKMFIKLQGRRFLEYSARYNEVLRA